MAPTIQQLISPELAGAAARIFKGLEDALPVYIHASGGSVAIGGGSIGPQTIDTLPIDADVVQWIQDVLRRLDQILDLDFELLESSNGSKINIYLDKEINLGDGSTTLGLALSNEPRRRSWWEVILNGPPLLRDLSYLRFAFIHELGHVFGLEHPFDNSDGDLGGERFGSPDAAVTVMSYTKPPGGWPSFYTANDMAAMVSLWGLEDDHGEEWLMQDQSGTLLLLSATAAEQRLALELPGDGWLGKAPAKPAPPELMTDLVSGDTLVKGLIAGGQWQVSWDGGRSWISGGPLPPADSDPLASPSTFQRTLRLPGPGNWELQVRQQDRWGRQSNLAAVSVTAATPAALSMEQILLPAAERQGLLRAQASSTQGQPVVFWRLEPAAQAKASVAAAIRWAVAQVDAAIALDFQEIPTEESPNLAQLVFTSGPLPSSLLEGGTLLGLHSSSHELVSVADITLRLDARNQITLDTAAIDASLGSSPGSYRLVALHELGHALGLRHPWEGSENVGLSRASFTLEQTVMAYASDGADVSVVGLSPLDRQALASLHGIETDPDEAPPDLPTSLPSLSLSPAEAIISGEDEAGAPAITTLRWIAQRQGNLQTEVQLGVRANQWSLNREPPNGAPALEAVLQLAPGQSEGLLTLPIPTGVYAAINLEAVGPRGASLEAESKGQLQVNVHKLELGLSPEELIDNRWRSRIMPNAPLNPQRLASRNDSIIAWHLDASLEARWGTRLRTLIGSIDQACRLEWIEVAKDNPLTQLTFEPMTTEEGPTTFSTPMVRIITPRQTIGQRSFNGQSMWQVSLPSPAPESSSPMLLSEEQQLLRLLLQGLGLETPEDSRDGDSYQRTVVFPEDSALFNAQPSPSQPSPETSPSTLLRPLDRAALTLLYGPQPSQIRDEAIMTPLVRLSLNSSDSGLRFSANGALLHLSLRLEKVGTADIESRVVLNPDQLIGSEAAAQALQPQDVVLAAGIQTQEVTLNLPTNSFSQLGLTLLPLAGCQAQQGTNTAASTAAGSHLRLDGPGLRALGEQLLADPITGWSLDLNGNQRLDPEIEGKVLMRYALGTFPGASLTNGLRPIASPPHDAPAMEALLAQPPAKRTEEQLAIGLHQGFLDLDGDGRLNPFSDALPLIHPLVPIVSP